MYTNLCILCIQKTFCCIFLSNYSYLASFLSKVFCLVLSVLLCIAFRHKTSFAVVVWSIKQVLQLSKYGLSMFTYTSEIRLLFVSCFYLTHIQIVMSKDLKLEVPSHMTHTQIIHNSLIWIYISIEDHATTHFKN